MPSEVIRVGVNGALGRMGQVTLRGLSSTHDMETVFAADRGDDLSGMIKKHAARVVVDFTEPGCVLENALAIVEAGASPVVGTTGLNREGESKLNRALTARGLGGIVAPNFSLGALVMMKLAEMAALHMKKCEIIECHHDRKKDRPSGTALLTAERLGMQEIPIHSIRLPGFMAQQQVLFGGEGEWLTITHNATSRDCFIPGILRAIRRVTTIKGLEVGLTI